jgi:WD40 repeat protein
LAFRCIFYPAVPEIHLGTNGGQAGTDDTRRLRTRDAHDGRKALSLKSADRLLEERGVQRELEGYVVAAAFDRPNAHAAFATGEGILHVVPLDDTRTWRAVSVHDGAILSMSSGPGVGFATGGDDGWLRVTPHTGQVIDVERFGSKWVEHVASTPGKLACTVGKTVHLFGDEGKKIKSLDHPSSVTGLVFDAKGKRIAASHYNGASLWFVASKSDNPRKLDWKGSHIGIAISPDGDSVVTAMQENALHGWRLSDGQHMRMSGYPSKTQSLSFTCNGKFLATSGAEAVVMWPFTGGGPMGKTPMELAGGDNVTCTMVACHPQNEVCAAGFSDGLVVLADINTQRILPVCGTGRGSVTALAWDRDGGSLAFGTEKGFAALVDFTTR